MYHFTEEPLSLNGSLIIFTRSNCRQMFKHIENKIPVSSKKVVFCTIVRSAEVIVAVVGFCQVVVHTII